MLYWEAKRGLEFLKRFRQKVVDYHNNAQWDDLGNDYDENPEAVRLRQQINEDIPEAITTCQKGGELTVVYNFPPPGTGGIQGEVDVLTNIFRLPSLEMDINQLLDKLDRAIGFYRYSVSYLWPRLFNPFYWIGKGLAFIGSVPFRIFRIAGFNVERAEKSFFGKLAKALLSLVFLIAALITIVKNRDLLASFIAAVKRLGGYQL